MDNVFLNHLLRNKGVKQGCPLFPTLFGLVIDKAADYIRWGSGEVINILGTPARLFLCTRDIILVFESHGSILHHLNAPDGFCMEKQLPINLGKTKAMIFHTFALIFRQAIFTLSGSQLEGVLCIFWNHI